MDSNQTQNFLLAITAETKRSYESPVILLTTKDYAENILNLLLEIRTALMLMPDTSQVTDILSTFHLEWVQAVKDIEAFKNRTRDTPREHIDNAVEFSIQCANKRYEKWQKILKKTLPIQMSPENAKALQNYIKTLSQMHENLTSSLRDKKTNFSVIVDPTEYNFKLLDETDELLNWLDYLNDNLAIQFSQIIGLKTQLTADLAKILREMIEDVATKPDEDYRIEVIRGKIKDIEDRAKRLKNKDSSAVSALKHKTMYYKDRLKSIENLRTSLVYLRNKSDSGKQETLHIFEHLLPPQLRCRLVEKLLKAWFNAIAGPVPEDTNIISILSVTDMKAMFNDGVGTIDKYEGKICVQNDASCIQLEAQNKHAEVCDDDKHVYFYDDCGLYYCNELNERIDATDNEDCYKEASRYLHDNLTPYSLSEKGINGVSMGNLVRSESEEYVECPRQPAVSESSDYLKRVVGTALRKCIAQVVLHQPEDPVKFLAQSLEDYQISERRREARRAEERALAAEREARMCDAYEAPTAPASTTSAEQELSYLDLNFVNYQTIDGDE
ncbi:hypothetical protein NE865_10982 [Phthorimaea operculella]|nr:hypothetical protein NE865_10982 [Phthorimaea operculella]